MRILLRVLAPLVSLGLAAAGALLVIEVLGAWTGAAGTASGVVVPWRDWRAVAGSTLWTAGPVLAVAVGAVVVGLVLTLLGLLARRHDVPLESPTPGLTLVTSPRVLARMVGREVRAADAVGAASVTASARAVTVRASGHNNTVRAGGDSDTVRAGGHSDTTRADTTRTDTTAVRDGARAAAAAVLDGLPLARRPRLTVRATPARPDRAGGR